MKKCSTCFIEKSLEEFPKQKTGKLGRRANCKTCLRDFYRTPRGIAIVSIGNQRHKSKLRNHPPPAYTVHELESWLVNQPNYSSVYEKWKSTDYHTDFKPSCDRINDYLPYTLDNIKLTTAKENVTRFYSDIKAGNNTKRTKEVHQYSLSGEYIKSFYSYREAARSVNGICANIRNVAMQRPIKKTEKDGSIRYFTPKTAYGFIWKN